MAKSKTRKNRRIGAPKSLSQLAANRAGKSFAQKICEKVQEGTEHRLSLELADSVTSTFVRMEKGVAKVADPAMSEHLMVTLASMQTAAITPETYDESAEEGEEPLRFVRVWLVDGGVFYPIDAEDARASAHEEGRAGLDLTNVVFKDAFRLT